MRKPTFRFAGQCFGLYVAIFPWGGPLTEELVQLGTRGDMAPYTSWMHNLQVVPFRRVMFPRYRHPMFDGVNDHCSPLIR